MDPLLTVCEELFELLEQVCANRELAAEMWTRSFWFKFDGESRPNIPDYSEPQLIAQIRGATLLMKALIESGFFKKE